MKKTIHLALLLMCFGVSSFLMSCSEGVSSNISDLSSVTDSELIADSDLHLKGWGGNQNDRYDHRGRKRDCDHRGRHHRCDDDDDDNGDDDGGDDGDDGSGSSGSVVSYNTGAGTIVDRVTIDGATETYNVFTYSIWAGQSSYAGNLIAGNDDSNFIFSFDTDESADIGDLHVYIWTDESEIPDSRPAPGQAPYVIEGVNADNYDLFVSVSDLTCGSTYYISSHMDLIADAIGSDTGGDTGVDDGNVRNKGRGGKSHRGGKGHNGHKGHRGGDDDCGGDDGDDGDNGEEVTPNSDETAYAGGNGFTNEAGAWWGYFEYTVTCQTPPVF